MALSIFRGRSLTSKCHSQIRCLVSSITRDIKSDDLTIKKTLNPKQKPDNSNLVFGKHMTDHMFVAEWSKQGGWAPPAIIPYQSLPLAPSASSLHYGLEIFEGMKAYRAIDGSVRLFRPEENMQRLHNSALRLSLPAFDREEMLKCLIELVKVEQGWIPNGHDSSLYIRPTMISTDPTLGVKPPESAMLFVITGPVGPYFDTGFKPVSLLADPAFVRAWPGGIGDCKAGGNYGPTIFAQKKAIEKGCSQCLWLYQDEITEVGTMNFFMYWVNESGERELITPPLNGLILPGITRKSLLELARSWPDFNVVERTFTIHDVTRAAKEGRVLEIFGAGTACVVCPVERILYGDAVIEVPRSDGDEFPVAMRFFRELTDIQYGRVAHDWSIVIEDGGMEMGKQARR